MENRNLQWNKRIKVPLILIFSVNTNHESVAYRSFSPSEFEARGARKVTTGINCGYFSISNKIPQCRTTTKGKIRTHSRTYRSFQTSPLKASKTRRPLLRSRHHR